MKTNTRFFGEVEIDDNKIITLPQGIIGFPELTKFAMIFNNEEKDPGIYWFQSLDETAFAMPVLSPYDVMANYSPNVTEDIISVIGEIDNDDFLVLVTLTVPHDKIEDMSINLKAPIIINTKTNRGVQVIVENDEYKVKHPIYEKLQAIRS